LRYCGGVVCLGGSATKMPASAALEKYGEDAALRGAASPRDAPSTGMRDVVANLWAEGWGCCVTYIPTPTPTHTYTHIHIHTHTPHATPHTAHPHTHTHTPTHLHTHTYIYTHTHTHKHTHTHTNRGEHNTHLQCWLRRGVIVRCSGARRADEAQEPAHVDRGGGIRHIPSAFGRSRRGAVRAVLPPSKGRPPSPPARGG
jgi:hypothetical protein